MTLAKFSIFTGLLKAYEDGGKKSFRTTASSTITDLAGDEITTEGIEKMAEKAKGNLTIFLNHEYRVPEDVLGSCKGTSMQTRGVDSEGNPIVDLDFDIDLNDANPRALQTWEAIKSGVKLGTSIGAIVRHAEKKKGGGLRIDDLELLEASIVGIPANPRSWVHYAAKSVNGVLGETESAYLIDEETVIKEVDETLEAIVDDIEKAATCKGCGHSSGCDCTDCSCKSKDIEPDKEAQTQVTVVVNEGAQEAPPSTPESALADETADGDDAVLGDSITQDVEPDITKDAEPDETVDTEVEDLKTAGLAAIATKLQELVTENTDLRKSLVDMEAERDELKENFVVAKEIIERIADLPIGRKTAFSGPLNDFRTKFPQYDNEFMKMLEK
jgi:phage head maturation protease